MPDPRGGRDELAGAADSSALGVPHEPSAWFIDAVHAALDRARYCEHARPGQAAGLVLRSGWVNCKSPECAAKCPDDMRVVPPSGEMACERCGSHVDVMVAFALSEELDVAYLMCRSCNSMELPGAQSASPVAAEPAEVVQPSRWLREAVQDALKRMRPCQHLRPDPPLVYAALVLHSGSMTCADCPVPPDSAILPTAGPLACDRCGELAEVAAFTWPFTHLLVGYRLCRPCVEREALEIGVPVIS